MTHVSKFNIINHSSSITAGNVAKGLVHPQNSTLQKTENGLVNSDAKHKSVDLDSSAINVALNTQSVMNKLQPESSLGPAMKKPSTSTHKDSFLGMQQRKKGSILKIMETSQYNTIDAPGLTEKYNSFVEEKADPDGDMVVMQHAPQQEVSRTSKIG